MGLITKIPAWLRKGLGIEGPWEGVIEVAGGPARPVYDPFQGGWFDLEWRFVEVELAASQPQTKLDLVTASADFGVIVLHIAALETGGVSALNTVISANNVHGGGDVMVSQAEVGAAGTTAGPYSHVAFADVGFGLSGVPQILYPPGWAPSVILGPTAAGQTHKVRMNLAEYSRGFRPI